MALRSRALLSVVLLAALLPACSHQTPPARVFVPSVPGDTHVGPDRGALVIVGGGTIGNEIITRFVQLAGGPKEAHIVMIPTAVGDSAYPQDWVGALMFRGAGVKHLTILHAPTRADADREDFLAPLREATGVWFPGGRQFRLADSYLHTRALDELHALLERGGVIGGTSAGASILASYLIRGARETNTTVMAPGYEQGFDFLHSAAVDQHLSQRNRENDMVKVVERYPTLLGIGLDESTAIVVRGDTAEVLGRGRAAFYNIDPHDRKSYFWLNPGDRFNLNARHVIADR